MSNSLRKPCMEYKPAFVQSEMEKVKLKNVVELEGGRNPRSLTKEKKCPIFTGKEGIEGLLYVERRFRKVAEYLNWTTGTEKYDGFEEVLADTAKEHWENIVGNIEDANRTVERFDESIRQFYLKYCDEEARDTMFKYLCTLKRPVGEEPQLFADRIETLVSYSNKLPGIEAPLQDDSVKIIIFDSFPETWQETFVRSGKVLREETLSEILQFMKNEKKFADKKDRKNLKHKGGASNDEAKRIRGGGMYRGSQQHYNQGRNYRGGRYDGRNNRNYDTSNYQRNNNYYGNSSNNNQSSYSNNFGRNNFGRNNNGGGRGYNNGGRGNYRGGRTNNNGGGRGFDRNRNHGYYNQQQNGGPNNHRSNEQSNLYYYNRDTAHNRKVNTVQTPAQAAPNTMMEAHHFDMIGNQNNGSGPGSAWSSSNNDYWTE